MPKKTFFAGDFHLGVHGKIPSRERELQIARWLDQIQPEAEALYLMGDLFDFWFEYRSVVPKGYLRLLGRLADWRDAGIPVYIFTGNHDLWMFRYFEEELGIPVYREPIRRELHGKTFVLGHGDGLGPGDYGYKFLKRIFRNRICQGLFAALHPDLAFALANYWSRRSRLANMGEDVFLGPENEWLLQYCEEQLLREQPDFFIFGHRHLPIDYTLSNGHSRYINLGEWVHSCSYAEFDGTNLQLRFFENPHGRIFP
jgi:UDP-2,3-diacylglucosamine hydrolase